MLAAPWVNRLLNARLTSGEHFLVNERHDQCEGHPAEHPDEHILAQPAALETCVVQRPCEIRYVGDRIREESNPSTGQYQGQEMDRFSRKPRSRPRGTRCTTTENAYSEHSCNHIWQSSLRQHQSKKAGVEAENGLILSGVDVENLW